MITCRALSFGVFGRNTIQIFQLILVLATIGACVFRKESCEKAVDELGVSLI